jgi:hypothetical protein
LPPTKRLLAKHQLVRPSFSRTAKKLKTKRADLNQSRVQPTSGTKDRHLKVPERKSSRVRKTKTSTRMVKRNQRTAGELPEATITQVAAVVKASEIRLENNRTRNHCRRISRKRKILRSNLNSKILKPVKSLNF